MASQPVKAEPSPESKSLALQALFCSCPPVPSSGGLQRIVCPLFSLVGSWACPLFGLGDALTCPLRELVGACLAFVLIGQFSVTLPAKGRITARMGEWDRKLRESWGSSRERVSHPSGMDADRPMVWGSLPGILLSIHFLALPCPARPRTGGCWVQECGWEGPLNLALKEFFKACSSLNFPQISKQHHLHSINSRGK